MAEFVGTLSLLPRSNDSNLANMKAFQLLRQIESSALMIVALFAGSVFSQQQESHLPETAARLSGSTKSPIKVAFIVTDGAVMIDFAGPWEVFQDAMLVLKGHSKHEPGMAKNAFDLYSVSDTRQPIRISGGMHMVPDYTFDDVPPPNIVVIPAQDGHSQKMMDWIRRMYRTSDVTMSVCTGAFTLAQTGLLDGKKATTHHDSWGLLHTQFPRIEVLSNKRYVQSDPVLFTSGGLSSGIDLALHIVELYFGHQVAEDTADTMEYEGADWKGDGTASVKYKDAMAGMKMDNMK
jgi:transcriptional regulator GlxA family with amidase domain